MKPEHYDAAIVGSGFGGSIMAYKLSEAGMSVCLLERGKSYPPGSFPRSPSLMKANFWDPSEGLYGLYDIWSFRELESIICSGLGGGSLIYANVLLRKNPAWFVQHYGSGADSEHWPITYEDLEPHYTNVETILRPTPYPVDFEPYKSTPKTNAFQEAARKLGLSCDYPNLAITFGNDPRKPSIAEEIIAPPNLHGTKRYTCRLCGECDVGCNYGSKNTLDYTYLTLAQKSGAKIHTLCEVRSFRPKEPSGYVIEYVEHDLAREGQRYDTSKLPVKTLTADNLILSAGTLGTSYLLLKNRAFFPKLSHCLGTRFSGNGDLLTFAMRCKSIVEGRLVPRVINGAYGPVITSSIFFPDELNKAVGRGYYIQDAGYPEFVNWIVETINVPGLFQRSLRFAERYICRILGINLDSHLSFDVSKMLGDAYMSNGGLPLLGMGRDVPGGKISLRGKYLDISWGQAGSRSYFTRLRNSMNAIADALHADFMDNPLWQFARTITVHPLGGCPMGETIDSSVVNSYGEVFGYAGLIIADGSVMPGPVGANPSLTIAALADRFANKLINK